MLGTPGPAPDPSSGSIPPSVTQATQPESKQTEQPQAPTSAVPIVLQTTTPATQSVSQQYQAHQPPIESDHPPQARAHGDEFWHDLRGSSYLAPGLGSYMGSQRKRRLPSDSDLDEAEPIPYTSPERSTRFGRGDTFLRSDARRDARRPYAEERSARFDQGDPFLRSVIRQPSEPYPEERSARFGRVTSSTMQSASAQPSLPDAVLVPVPLSLFSKCPWLRQMSQHMHED